MIIREFQENDRKAVKEIFALYWTDPEFLEELSNELHENSPSFFVAEEGDEIVGIVGFKKLPEYLKPYALTSNPVEFYVIAVKYRRKGIGESLKQKLIEEARRHGFSEILLYSPHTHDESWNFHDTLGFERAGKVTPPEDEVGHLWRKIL
jgi:N-acetylglutamate synthase-like GNAT family acetyltransferase